MSLLEMLITGARLQATTEAWLPQPHKKHYQPHIALVVLLVSI